MKCPPSRTGKAGAGFQRNGFQNFKQRCDFIRAGRDQAYRITGGRDAALYQKRRAPKHIYTMGIVQWYTLAQEMEDPYYLQIRQGIETFCEQNGVRIQRIFKADWQNTDALPAVDGLLCVGNLPGREAARFKQHTSKLVFLDMDAPQPGDSSITLDFEQAVGAALCYLQGLGHTRIGYLGGQEFLADGTMYPDARKRWFLDFCKKMG